MVLSIQIGNIRDLFPHQLDILSLHSELQFDSLGLDIANRHRVGVASDLPGLIREIHTSGLDEGERGKSNSHKNDFFLFFSVSDIVDILGLPASFILR
jgi:hypothetical protein